MSGGAGGGVTAVAVTCQYYCDITQVYLSLSEWALCLGGGSSGSSSVARQPLLAMSHVVSVTGRWVCLWGCLCVFTDGPTLGCSGIHAVGSAGVAAVPAMPFKPLLAAGSWHCWELCGASEA